MIGVVPFSRVTVEPMSKGRAGSSRSDQIYIILNPNS
jgi:hypothetical protein